ncbi:hypothetical protein CSB20_10545 [bacterium DOLZORAL124_64_63]|nr:MAG: hypothetical protein CSB20_10545 [bacterium DOLZORAL124_64_63]
MKHVIAIALIVLIAGTALAEVKQPDTQNATMVNASKVVITGELDTSSPTWNRGWGNNDVSLECAYPLVDSSEDGQAYAAFAIMSTDDQPIEIIVDGDASTVNDTWMGLYCADFDAEDPLTNAVIVDDDGGVWVYSAITVDDNVVLPAGEQFWLVLSTYSPGDYGTFTIDTSANVELFSVANTSASWGMVKGMYR